VDPVEKKPLNHFYPGSSSLSFGTAGCNLGCQFCQAWEITKSREVLHLLSQHATPEMIAEAAVRLGCHSVSFTYNDPVIWAEYAIDTAQACHDRGLKTIAVTAGYINPDPREAFFSVMDATNVDLKGFTENFYQHYCLSHLAPVLDTLKWLAHHSSTWLEITNLVIPGANDRDEDIRRMCEWIVTELGADVPLHFSAFFPAFRMQDTPPTGHGTLIRARETALQAGLNYVYIGNVFDRDRESTYCPACKRMLIERNWYSLGEYHLQGNLCAYCGYRIAGHFGDAPGMWGRRRMSVNPAQLLKELESTAAAKQSSEF
jgi:AmmeMemoRadiSam system radical SAM enzyme